MTSPATSRTPAAKAATRKTPTRKSVAAPEDEDVDSPILPVEQLEALHQIKPDAVDWLIAQTQAEAEYRRAEIERVNNLIFLEHMFAQAAALIIAAGGIGGGVWLAQNGQPWVGFAVTAVVMAALAVIQLSARTKRP